jgi:hypothetical protein
MRSKGRSAAWLILLLTASSCLLLAQSHRSSHAVSRKTKVPAAKTPAAKPPTEKTPSIQLVDSDQGLAILGAALETKHPGRAGADCSHLVHAIYEKAGFPYTYTPSSDLYVGTDEFRRVAQPQAGDLVVWIGHAGIVVNPRERTFYSALRSGLRVQAYDSPYWKRRGRPHFLRYVRGTGAPVLTASNRGTNLTPVKLHDAWSREAIPGENIPDRAAEMGDMAAPFEDLPNTVPTVPTTVNVESNRPRPEEVRAALLQEFQEAGDALAERDVLKLYPSLVAFERFEVKKVQVKGDQGWAEIHIGEPSLISNTGSRAKKYPKVQRWSLHRESADVWELALPGDAIYLPQDVAVRLMAHQLATLTDANSSSNGSNDDKASLARWLNVLLAESSAH